MKNLLLFFLGFLAAAAAGAQTKGSAKLYGYRQSVLPGVNNGVTTVEGAESPATSANGANYFLYLTSASRVYPSEMWINGQQYSVRMQTLTSTPVTQAEGASRKVLVPKTSQRVMQLTPAPYVESKSQAGISRLAASNEVVVVYKENGRFRYSTLKKLTDLEAAAMQ